ncbi:MAG TPA: GNAT family N-acetyltransferase [Archangium sp.]|nr:GNAT family N-acetyltransferase [Archangium sp.]
MNKLILVPKTMEAIKAVESKEICERAKAGGCTKNTRLYLAMQGTQEVGFLSLDLHPKDFFVYEIFVPKKYRRRQVGSYLLEQAERIASASDYSVVLLKPYPLDSDLRLSDLVSWYERRGYVTVNSELMLKRLSI